MMPGCTIDPVARISDELAAIEREHGVRLVLAVESGSRAWGFPSRDSDYDVRFLYLRPLADYLSVMPRRDVIERPIDATLDLNGWDVRKAMQLLVRSNAVLIEWLTSPVRYREALPVPKRLLDLARATASLSALEHHYDHQARRSFGAILAGGGAARLKTYCYALRAALALIWLRQRREVPPMDVGSLMAGLPLSGSVADGIQGLLARKRDATERDTTQRIPILERLIAEALEAPVRGREPVPRAEVAAQADALFAELVLGGAASRLAAPDHFRL